MTTEIPEPGTRRKMYVDFAAVFLLALLARAAALLVLMSPLAVAVAGRPVVVGSALDGYHQIGLELAAGRGFSVDADSGPTAARAPLYPLLLAVLYRVFGAGPAPVLWSQAILGATTCALVFVLGQRMFDRASGLAAGAMFALYPPHVAWSWYVMSETLLVFLLVASCLALVGVVQAPAAGRALLAGAVFGLTALCNSVILLVPPILLLVAAIAPRGRRAYLPAAALILVATCAIVLPWTARNYVTFHRVIPVHWGAGWTYMKGAFMAERHLEDPGLPMWRVDQAATEDVLRILEAHGFGANWRGQGPTRMSATGIAGLEEEEFLSRWARRWVIENPFRAARKFVVNLWLYWHFSRNSVAYLAVGLPLCALALLALARGAWRRLETRVVVLFSLTLYLAYAMMLSCARYSLQIMPFVSVLAAVAVVDLARRAKRRDRPAAGGRTPGPA